MRLADWRHFGHNYGRDTDRGCPQLSDCRERYGKAHAVKFRARPAVASCSRCSVHPLVHPDRAGITFGTGFLVTPAVGVVFMARSAIIVAIDAQPSRSLRR